MIQTKWHLLLSLGFAMLLLTTTNACGDRTPTPTPPAPTIVAYSPLPTPTVAPAPTKDESIIFIRPNGDVVLYTLADQRAVTLLKAAYFFGDGQKMGGDEIPLFHIMNFPLHPSPDGKWLLVATPNQGTWLAAMDGSMQRQISPTILGATWAPDSQQITYVGAQTGTDGAPQLNVLYTQNVVTGAPPRPLLKSEAYIGLPAWSPGCETTPTPADRSCGRHIFVFASPGPDGSETMQATLVDVMTGKITALGPSVWPPWETVTDDFRWSPTGDEFWAPTGTFNPTVQVAYPIDGTGPRPLVSACDSGCAYNRRNGKLVTSGGWTILYKPSSYNEEIYAQSPTGEQIEVASDAYFAGTLAQLHGTEVDEAQAEIVPLHAPSSTVWNERIIQNAGMSYRLPPEWDESGADAAKLVRNYRVAGGEGFASLNSDQLTLSIAAEYFMSDSFDEVFQQWLNAIDAQEGMRFNQLDQPLPGYIANDYDTQEYQVEGELIHIGNRPAVRLHSALFPYVEKIVIPLKEYRLTITIWPRPSSQDAVLEEILASFVLPTPTFVIPPPAAPSPLATPTP